mgnify:CR=1 FL=1
MDLGIRPMTFNTNPDGSTKWIFAQLTGFNGFAVVDFATQQGDQAHPESGSAAGKGDASPRAPIPRTAWPSTPDGKTLVVCSRLNNYLYSYSLPDLKADRQAPSSAGKGAGWVTLTPDGKTAYVANPVTNDVSVVDIKTMKETTRIAVGICAEAKCHRDAPVEANAACEHAGSRIPGACTISVVVQAFRLLRRRRGFSLARWRLADDRSTTGA